MKSKDDGSRGPGGPDGSVTPRYITKKSPRNVRHGVLETSLTISRVFSKIEFFDYTGNGLRLDLQYPSSSFFSPAQQKTMGQTGAHVKPHDVAARVDLFCIGKGSAGDINRSELAPAQQKTMGQTGAHVEPHDVAARVDPAGPGSGGAGEIK